MTLITLRQAVNHFVDDIIRQPAIGAIIMDWRVEEEIIVSIIVAHLNSLGIFYIDPNMREILEADVIFQLKNSKLIQEKVIKAASDERNKKQKTAALSNV